MQKEMIGEIEAARPDVLVYVNISESWVNTRQLRSTRGILSWMQGYVRQNYVIEGIVDIGSVTEYLWGEQAKNALPRSKNYVWIFKRKPP
jgi:hypothetical protein